MAGDIGEVAFGDRVEVIRELESVEFPHAVGTILQVVAPSKGDESIRARAYINGHLYCWSYPRTHLARPGYLQAEIAALTEQLAEAREIIEQCKPYAAAVLKQAQTNRAPSGFGTLATLTVIENSDALLARIAAWERKQ